jgi:dihydroflavonol-4-reductase
MPKTVLVTGISGFIAKHVAIAFLDAGYNVRGTVRDLAQAGGVRRTISDHAPGGRLEFAVTDLLSDNGWADAVTGCDGVAHVASPLPLVPPRDDDDVVRPAVDGTLRVMKSAIGAKVKRFVQTSAAYAVMVGHDHKRTAPFTEDDWGIVGAPGLNSYKRSKLLAERAAREHVATTLSDIHFSSILPGFVAGPALDGDTNASAEVFRMVLAGRYPGMPRLSFPVADARDVALAHVAAMENDAPSGSRYLVLSDSLWMIDVARILREELGERARKVPNRQLPDFLVRLIPGVRSVLPDLGWRPSYDTSRSRRMLGMEYRPAREVVAAAARSLVELDPVSR